MKKITIRWSNGQEYSQAFSNKAVSGIVNEHFDRSDVTYLSIQKYPLKDNDEIVIKKELPKND